VRFGDRFDAQGILAGSRDASRCIGYLIKYLTKHVGDCHQASTQDQATRTTCPTGNDCPTSSPTASNGRPHSNKLAAEPQRRSNPPRSNRPNGMSGAKSGMSDRLLTVAEAAEVLCTSERFPRRLIAERRIRFTRIGRHVRVLESALREFIAAGLVEPITTRRTRRAA
jgi:excisionase family DNA binding protein